MVSGSRTVFTAFCSSIHFARRTIPLAEATCSRQPWFPQPQAPGTSSSTWMCPISPPAPCAPVIIFPLIITPPPTPVPRVTITPLLWPAAAPFHISPNAATFASFPPLLGSPVNSVSSLVTSLYPHPRLAVCGTTPLASIGPGTPIPIPATSFLSIPRSSSLPSAAFAISGRIAAPSFSVWLGISHFSRSSPSVRNSPIFTVVPPTSIPKQYSCIFLSPWFSISYCG